MSLLARLRWPLIWLAAIATIVLLHPWTVRPTGADGGAVEQGAFDPQAHVNAIWESRVLAARPQTLAPSALFTEATIVSGEGRVLSVDTSSRVGRALVDLTPGDGQADVSLQIGAVLRGTALRDAVGLRFADFASQMDYALVADRLNRRALNAIGDVPLTVGKSVRFTGAAIDGGDGIFDVVPFQLEVQP